MRISASKATTDGLREASRGWRSGRREVTVDTRFEPGRYAADSKGGDRDGAQAGLQPYLAERLGPQTGQNQKVGAVEHLGQFLGAAPTDELNCQLRLVCRQLMAKLFPSMSLRPIASKYHADRTLQGANDPRQGLKEGSASFEQIHPPDEQQPPWRAGVR